MKLEDLDGDVYVSESLLSKVEETLENSQELTVKINEVYVGILQKFSISETSLKIKVKSSIDPLFLLSFSLGEKLSIEGVENKMTVKKISYDNKTSICSLKAILTNLETQNE